RFEYDPQSRRLLRVIDANGIALRNNVTYTATGQVAAEDMPSGGRLAYSYYPGSDLLESVTETGPGVLRTTSWTYSDRRWVTAISFSDGVNPDSTARFDYNAAGDIVSISSPDAGYIRFSYDRAGNRIRDS
ncbi:hypothetical protein, partial [Lysobacter sp. A3-1-A15]